MGAASRPLEIRPLTAQAMADIHAAVDPLDASMAVAVLNALWSWHRANDGANLPRTEAGLYTGILAKALGIRRWSVERERLNDVLFRLRDAGIVTSVRDDTPLQVIRWTIRKDRRKAYGV